MGGAVADRASGAAFSVESVAPDPEPSAATATAGEPPFGFHAAYKWLDAEQMQRLLTPIAAAYAELEAEAAATSAA